MARILITLDAIGYEVDAFAHDNLSHDPLQADAMTCRDFGGDHKPDVVMVEMFDHLKKWLGNYEKRQRTAVLRAAKRRKVKTL